MKLFLTNSLILLLLLNSNLLFPKDLPPDDPYWQTFVAGSIDDLPDSAIKSFLIDSQRNNPFMKQQKRTYADIDETLKKLGPFAPEAGKVVWIPTIDMPLDEENWRFLSSTANVPENIINLAYFKKNGKFYVRMFLHPRSTQHPKFIKMAESNGGFKYEFQGAFTASLRSMIAWKTEKEKGEKNESIDFPKDPSKFIWPKVSVHNADVHGSRLNPAKKMVRASGVTQLMGTIPQEVKDKIGFDFAGEYVVGVPDGTDAGFVLREVLPEYLGKNKGRAEPAFSTLTPERLSELTKGLKGEELEKYIEENIMRPLAKTISYLFMQEGMLGEYHTQNFSYVLDKNGKLTGKILLHDADAFRTSLVLRALNEKNIDAIRDIEAPFFFLKDATFTTTSSGGMFQSFNLNGLMQSYVINNGDISTIVGAIANWVKKKSIKAPWATPYNIRDKFLKVFAQELTPYVGREVTKNELNLSGMEGESVGLIKLFKERIKLLSKSFEAIKPEAELSSQKVLRDEYLRLNNLGLVKSLTSADLDIKDTTFILHTENGNTYISAHPKIPNNRGPPVKGIALLGPKDDDGTQKFIDKLSKKEKIALNAYQRCRASFGNLAQPIQRRISTH